MKLGLSDGRRTDRIDKSRNMEQSKWSATCCLHCWQMGFTARNLSTCVGVFW